MSTVENRVFNKNSKKSRTVSEQELWTIESNAGAVSTSELARRLRVSPKKIHRLYQKIGVSPYDNDGFYTASAVARFLDIPVRTFQDNLKKGKYENLSPFKVGHFWRVSWDGKSPILPSWSGKSISKEELGSQNGHRDDCASCGEVLAIPREVWPEKTPTINDFWCTRKCRAEFIQANQLAKISPLSRPNDYISPEGFPPHMRPVNQKWLAEIGLLEQFGTVDSELRLAKVGVRYSENHTVLKELFKRYFHLFIPRNIIAEEVYKGRSVSNWSIQQMISRFREELVHNNMQNIYRIGWSFGAKCDLSDAEWRIARLFWQRSETWVPTSYVAFSIYPDFDINHIEEFSNKAFYAARRIRPKLRNKNIYKFSQEERPTVSGGVQKYLNFHRV